MRTCGALILSLTLFACSGGGKKGQRSPGDPSDPGDTGETGDSGGGEQESCCCESYDLDTPDILYSTMAVSECKSAGGTCEDTTDACETD